MGRAGSAPAARRACRSRLRSYWAGGAEVVGPAVGLDADDGTAVGRVDHLAGADDDPDMRDIGRVGAEEDEIAGLERLAGRDGRAGVVLGLRDARQPDTGRAIGGLHETR